MFFFLFNSYFLSLFIPLSSLPFELQAPSPTAFLFDFFPAKTKVGLGVVLVLAGQ